MIAALPTSIVIVVGMVPTIVTLIVDVTPGRYLTRCVIGLNVAGMTPFLHSLWTGANDVTTAVGIVTNPVAWLIIYGASAIGWMLFLGLPGAVAVFETLNAKRRIYILQEKQRSLLEEWGDSIRSPAESARNNAANASGGGLNDDPTATAAAGTEGAPTS